jgi:hypothetical protein
MEQEHLDVHRLHSFLTEIVSHWPKGPAADKGAIPASLRGYLADGFNAIDLLNYVQAVASIEDEGT